MRTARRDRWLATLAVLGLWAPQTFATHLTPQYACEKRLGKNVLGYTKKRRDVLLTCARKLLTCEINLEVDDDNPTSCRNAVNDYCQTGLSSTAGKMPHVRAKFEVNTASYCMDVGIATALSTGSGGLWHGNSAVCGTSPDVPSLIDCLFDQADSATDAFVSLASPRAGLLLDGIGLGPDYPNLARPPVSDVTVTATAPSGGTLVPLGTLVVPAGTALRLSGDGATLPCGSPSNGRLVLTVGEQERTLDERYGSGAVALFGPWFSGQTIPYSIALKDGSCMDTVAGTVSVP